MDLVVIGGSRGGVGGGGRGWEGGGGWAQAHAPLLGQTWARPNRKMMVFDSVHG